MYTIDEIRHANLLRLIERYGGTQVVAERVGRSHAQISQLKNRNKHSGTTRPRVIGDDVARALENAFELPRGWMDNSDVPFPGDDQATEERSWTVVVADLMQKAPAEERRAWIDFTQRYFIERNRALFTGEDLARYDVLSKPKPPH